MARKAGSQSAGYHYDATPRNPAPTKTPTVAPKPGQAAKGPAGDYKGASADYVAAVEALPPKAQRVTEQATLRASKKRAAAQKRKTRAILRSKPPKAQKAAKLKKYQPPKLPSTKPVKFEGKPTAGTPTLGELKQAKVSGTLKVNKAEAVTTPKVRVVSHKLAKAKKAVAKSSNAGAIHRKYPELSKKRIKAIGHAARKTGTPAPLLAAISGVESDYGRSTLPGVHSGENEADAAGPFQMGNVPGGAAGDSYHENAQEIWGPKAGRHSEYNFKDEAVTSANYLKKAGATHDPATWNAAALSYNHDPAYAAKVESEAKRLAGVAKATKAGNPKATQHLKRVEAQAEKVGLKAPDTKRKGDTVLVRADAKGMVGWAKALIGTQEGSKLQVKWAGESGVSPAEPWCSEFIAAGLKRRGLPSPSNPAYSGTWLDWKGGKNIGTNIAKAKPGDVLVFGPPSSTSHVGLYVGSGKMISGNYSDEVAVSPVEDEIASAGLAGIVRPKYQGGTVRVKAGAPLPASAIGPGGVLVSAPAGGEAATGTTGEKKQKPELTAKQVFNRTNKKLKALSSSAPQKQTSSTLSELQRKYGVAA